MNGALAFTLLLSEVEIGTQQSGTARRHMGVVVLEYLVEVTLVGQVLHVELQVDILGQAVVAIAS
ncbi:hypothetical protein AB7M22_000090 [Pseudomonas sp. ADAK2 TE3594]